MNMPLDKKILVSSFLFISINILVISSSNYAIAAENFTIIANIDLTSIPNPEKLKVLAFANGESAVKYIENLNNVKSKSISVPFTFEKTNDFVTVGSRDEYAVCAYDLNAQTNEMKSYSCIEGNLENPSGKNPVNIGSGPVITLSTGSFKPVNGAEVKNPTIVVWIENLAGKKHLKDIKAVAMVKGEFKSKIIDARKLLAESKDKIIKVPLLFDKTPEIGPIRVGDYFFSCVSANVLKPVEGNECEHRIISHTGHIHNIVARHD